MSINIHIIATNDIHGALFSSPHEANMMKAASYVRMIETKSDNVLLIDNGNALSGSLCTYYFSGLKPYVRNPMISMMNRMHYDASGISPNEFRYGMAYFNKAQALASFPFLSANMLHRRTKEPYFGNPYIIKQISGMKIGIIGLTSLGLVTNKAVEMIDEFEIEETIQAAKRWIRHMHDKESPDFVIALYHGGLSELAAAADYKQYISSQAEAIIQATEGIDVIITGHQKQTMAKKIEDTLFIQAGSNMSHLCHLQLTFKERTNTFELIDSQSELVDVTSYPEDQALKEMLYYEEDMYWQWTKKIVTTEFPDYRIHDFHDFYDDHPFKALLHQLLKMTGAEITCCHLPHIEAAGLYGTVTEADLYRAYVSIDYPVHLSLSGKTIRRMMERSAAALYEEDRVYVRTDMLDPTTVTDWSGFNYTIDVTAPIGHRVLCSLEDDRIYLVAATDYLYRHYKDLMTEDNLLSIDKRHMIEHLGDYLVQYQINNHMAEQ